ncbi:MAG: contractile injection system tape measure protein [Candidatus Chryseobacterium colombiense]|nr:contractile injection system tape measure protein [Chryseobacterium sp.]WEK71328.1 MAG: contractile injection system tape measure protein [Chryseobacterium sp.]
MEQDHIIQKVFVEIAVNNKEKAMSIKEDINSFLSVDVFPQIEKYINALEYKLEGHTLQIPRLELDLNVKSSSLNVELKDKIVQLFEEKLSEMIKPIEILNQEAENDSKAYWISNQEKMVRTFIYFLEKGHMPWWNSEKKGFSFLEPEIFDVMIQSDNFEKSIISVLPKHEVQNRMINQLSNEQIAQICLTILKSKELKISLEPNIISYIAKLNHKNRLIIWSLVLNVISEYLISPKSHLQEYIVQQISKIDAADSLQIKTNRQNLKTVIKIFPFIEEIEILESIKKDVFKNQEKEENSVETIDDHEPETTFDDLGFKEDGHYIQNAGLIILHPFLKTFFEHCDLIHPKTQQLTDPELCAHLLHYIATGKTNAPEYDMIFEKFLCNIPMNQSINRHIKLSRKHKTQVKNLIESVQQNWKPMKKSSGALLQNEFFQRSGKLVVTDHDYTLTVERKTQDILLDKLAWGISFVKLPWKEKFMFVNW